MSWLDMPEWTLEDKLVHWDLQLSWCQFPSEEGQLSAKCKTHSKLSLEVHQGGSLWRSLQSEYRKYNKDIAQKKKQEGRATRAVEKLGRYAFFDFASWSWRSYVCNFNYM